MVEGHEKVAEGSFCEIWCAPKALKVLKNAEAKDRARLAQILNELSENGYLQFNSTQFTSEGRFAAGGGKKCMVYAAKAYQLRLYGCFGGNKPRLFVCPEAAIKKDTKADRKQLERVARKAGE